MHCSHQLEDWAGEWQRRLRSVLHCESSDQATRLSRPKLCCLTRRESLPRTLMESFWLHPTPLSHLRQLQLKHKLRRELRRREVRQEYLCLQPAAEEPRGFPGHRVGDATSAEPVYTGALAQQGQATQQNQQLIAALMRRMDLEEKRRNEADEKAG